MTDYIGYYQDKRKEGHPWVSGIGALEDKELDCTYRAASEYYSENEAGAKKKAEEQADEESIEKVIKENPMPMKQCGECPACEYQLAKSVL